MSASINGGSSAGATGEQSGVAKDLVSQAADLASHVENVKEAAKGAVRARAARVREVDKTAKSARTRERILTAAGELIAENGNTDFQMAEVARRCGMSKGSLYYYYRDRDEIVQEIFSSGMDDFVSGLEGAVATARSSSEALYNLCVEFSNRVSQGGTVVLAVAAELVQGRGNILDTLEKRLYRIGRIVEVQLERAQAEGVVRSDVDCNTAASCVCGAFFFAAVHRMNAGGISDVDEFTTHLVDVLMRGVGCSDIREA